MKISVKTIKREIYTFDVEPTTKVSELKEMIEKSSGVEVSRQKLIYSGKFLEDNQSIETYGIKEDGYLVLYIKNAPAPSSVKESKPLQPVEVEKSSEVEPEVSIPIQESTLPDVQISEELIKSLVDMGFPEESVTSALNATGGNKELAVQYLLSEDFEDDMLLGAEEYAEGDVDALENEQEGEMDLISALRNNPSFNELRLEVQQNPALLEGLLQHIGEQQPELLQAIQQNQDEFLKLLQEPVTSNPHQTVIQITQEEKEAIERLMSLGFTKNQVVQAFIICDRNEELAANYLLNMLDEDFNN